MREILCELKPGKIPVWRAEGHEAPALAKELLESRASGRGRVSLVKGAHPWKVGHTTLED